MTTTHILPTGTKFRSASSRRFVVVVEYVPGAPKTVYRTDDVHRAIGKASKFSGGIVVDTVGRKARVFAPRPADGKLAYIWIDA
jgi:hypothetical protein